MLQFFLALFMVVGLFFAPGEANAAVRYGDSQQASKPMPVQNYGDFKQLTLSRDLGLTNTFINVTDFKFSGKEGDYGTFMMALNKKPELPVLVGISGSKFFTPDSNGNFLDGLSDGIIANSQNFATKNKVKFVSEIDNSGANRPASSEPIYFTISYTDPNLQSSTVRSVFKGMPTITNTNTPDPVNYNIDLDFRQVDEQPFWTKARRTLAQSLANRAAQHMSTAGSPNEQPDLALLNTTIAVTPGVDPSANQLVLHRYFDDLGIVLRPIDTKGFPTVQGLTSIFPQIGGGSAASPIPRLATMEIFPATAPGAATEISDPVLAATILHETGHALGLVGLSYPGALLVNGSVSPPVFTGANTTAANGGNQVILQVKANGSVDGHPESNPTSGHYHSVMSYLRIGNPATGGAYDICSTVSACDFVALDKALLKDHGYSVQ